MILDIDGLGSLFGTVHEIAHAMARREYDRDRAVALYRGAIENLLSAVPAPGKSAQR